MRLNYGPRNHHHCIPPSGHGGGGGHNSGQNNSSSTMGPVFWQLCRILAWLSFAGWSAGHVYSFVCTWSKYQLQYERKYIPYIESNCGDSRFHQVTLGLNHCDTFLEAIAIPAWERALFEEIQKLPVCSNGKCDDVVSGITNNKTWLCVCFVFFVVCSAVMLRIKWYLEYQIRSKLPLDNPGAYIESTVCAPSYVDREGRSWAVQMNTGFRHRINTGGDGNNASCNNGGDRVIMPCDDYSDVTL